MSDGQHESGSKASPRSSIIRKRNWNEHNDNDQESQRSTTARQVSFCDSIQYIPRRDDVHSVSLPHHFEEDVNMSQGTLLEPDQDTFDRQAAIYFGNRCQAFKFEDLPFVPDDGFGYDDDDDDFDISEEEGFVAAHHSRAGDSKNFAHGSIPNEYFNTERMQEHQSADDAMKAKIFSDNDETTQMVGRRTVRYLSW